MTVLTFAESLRRRAERVERALERLLPSAAAYPGIIHEAMRYSALGGGKRLRGVLLMEAAGLGDPDVPAAEAAGLDVEPKGSPDVTPEAMRAVGAGGAAAAAVEMVHAYSLVHDDLPCMDDDDFRRGRPSNHRVYGEGMAVLAGDALLTRAFEVLARLCWAGADDATTIAVTAELASAAGTAGLVGGQVADLEAEGALAKKTQDALDPADRLEYIHRHKTGALFRACLRMGGRIGRIGEDGLLRVTRYAESFGLAFQITDDILDVEGSTESMGKEAGSDAKKGKLTFVSLYGLKRAREMARVEVEKAKAELEPFGDRARFLADLADFVLLRDR